jgi:hypothetical protein
MLIDTLLRVKDRIKVLALLCPLGSCSKIDISLFLSDESENDVHVFERSSFSLGKEEGASGGDHTHAGEEEELFSSVLCFTDCWLDATYYTSILECLDEIGGVSSQDQVPEPLRRRGGHETVSSSSIVEDLGTVNP